MLGLFTKVYGSSNGTAYDYEFKGLDGNLIKLSEFENKVIIEIKSVEALNDVHLAQLLTYLKLSDCKLGMLINFNVALIKNGIKRVVNNL